MQQLQWITIIFRAWIFLGFLEGNEMPYDKHLTEDTRKLAETTSNLRDFCKGNWEVVKYPFTWQQEPRCSS